MKKTHLLLALVAGSSSLVAATPATTSSDSKTVPTKSRSDLHVYAQGDFLYWQVNASEQQYAFKSESSTVANHGSFVSPEFSFDPGFRLGLGAELWHDQWDSNIQWTSFHTTASSAEEGFLLLPYQLTTSFFDTATDQKTIKIDYIDWELGRSFMPTKYFGIRPFAGVRAQWIRAHSDLAAVSVDIPLNSGSGVIRENSWGLGPLLGLDANFYMIEGFSIAASGAASLLYGYRDLQAQFLNEQGSGFGLVDVNKRDHFRKTSVDLDLFLGLQWERMFDICYLQLKAGWEHHLFSEQWQHWDYNFIPNAISDLGTSGFTASATLEF